MNFSNIITRRLEHGWQYKKHVHILTTLNHWHDLFETIPWIQKSPLTFSWFYGRVNNSFTSPKLICVQFRICRVLSFIFPDLTISHKIHIYLGHIYHQCYISLRWKEARQIANINQQFPWKPGSLVTIISHERLITGIILQIGNIEETKGCYTFSKLIIILKKSHYSQFCD